MKSRRRFPTLARLRDLVNRDEPPSDTMPAEGPAAEPPDAPLDDAPPGAVAVYPFPDAPDEQAAGVLPARPIAPPDDWETPAPPARRRDGPAPLFEDSRGHLDAELRRAGYLVRAQLRQYWGVLEPERAGEAWGDATSRSHVQAYIGRDPLLTEGEIAGWAQDASEEDLDAARELEAQIDATRAALSTQQNLRLLQLAERFSLSPGEADALLICLLPELYRRYRTYFAYLQQDAAQPLPNLTTLRDVLTLADRAEGSLFRADGALLRHRLLALDGASPLSPAPQAQIEARVAAFLLERDGLDPRLAGIATWTEPPTRRPADEEGDATDRERLAEFQKWAQERRYWRQQRADAFYAAWRFPGYRPPPALTGATFLLHGPYGAGRRRWAEVVCGGLMPLLIVNSGAALAGAAATGPAGWEETVALVYREGRLRDAAVYWTGCEALIDSADGQWLPQWEYLLGAAEAYPHLTFFASETVWEPRGRFLGNHPFTRIDRPAPVYAARVALWRRRLAALEWADPTRQETEWPLPPRRAWPDEMIGGLAERLANGFQFTAGQMDDALRAAASIAREREPGGPLVSEADVFAGCRRQAGRRLMALARPVARDRLPTFADLQLPDATCMQLEELKHRVLSLKAAMNERDIDRRVLRGKGIVALFTGTSGTGKTTAAEALAGEVGVDLYKVDMSAVVSKWVGETEKQLNQVFTEAEAANAMLFFDEGDALFGRRGEVREAQDRWANQEVNFLLQRIEEYSGVVILATNFGQNIDEGFRRRIHIVVEFPFPDRALRGKLWRWSLERVGYPALDEPAYEKLAAFRLAGGAIQNIALTAVALPESGSDPMRPLLRAIVREYQKLGRPVRRGEFGRDDFKWIVDEQLL